MGVGVGKRWAVRCRHPEWSRVAPEPVCPLLQGSQDSVNLTSAGDDEGEWSRGSRYGHRVPRSERSGSKQSMMNRPQPVSPEAKQILHDSVDTKETLSVGGECRSGRRLDPPRARDTGVDR